ncbi:hypothetical protein [Thermomonospora umbrina]|uniref:Uncharacterized protein n=1 Tax=Thermomonospora umbrina TaxID=111806 RepID=A0A3D9SZ04_9ACTN|nr:hypothetical protein [Thermomonospora umbrina]REE96851.1 hypothetical protein DFJ69_2304 [Thermomonospora umbrina]
MSGFLVGPAAWWCGFPLALAVGLALVDGDSYAFGARDWAARVVLWMGLGGAVLAPVVGLVVALIGRRGRACAAFAAMGALSLGGFLYILYALAQA